MTVTLYGRRYVVSIRGAAGQWCEWEYACTLTECLERIEQALTAGEAVQVEIVRLWPDEVAALAESRVAS